MRIIQKIKGRFGDLDKMYSTIDAAMISVSRLLVGIIIARVSGVDDFSQYILFTAISVVFINLVASRFITPMANFAAGRSRADQVNVFSWTRARVRKIQTAALVLVCISGFLLCNGLLTWLVLIGFGFATVLELERFQLRSQLQLGFEMKRGALADCAGIAVMGILFLSGTFLFGFPVLSFWWGSIMGSLVSIFMMGFRLEGTNSCEESLLGETEKRSMEEIGKTMLIGSMANSACSRMQPFALKTIGGSVAVASFGAAWTFVGPIRMLTGALGGILRPRLAMYRNKGDDESFRSLTLRVNSLLFVFGGLGIFISALFGVEVMGLVFGNSLREAGVLLPIALAYGTLDSITSMQMIALQVLGKVGAQRATRLRVITAFLSVLLLIPSCYYWGALGAYGSLLLSEAVYGVGTFVYLKSTRYHL